MKRVLTVAIPDETSAQLAELAEREYRRPKDQAAILLIDAIERASVGPGLTTSGQAPTQRTNARGR